MRTLIAFASLLSLLTAFAGCASRVETQEHCTPQFPPRPCDEVPTLPPNSG
ncbi:MAG: hypothetical protein ABI364_00130 [Caldimonas sp.]